MSARGPRPAPRSETRKLLRITGLPAVAALFAAAPDRVERLFFDARLKLEVGPFCAELARRHKPYRDVEAEDLARLAGSVLHGGILALAQPRPVPAFDPGHAATWAPDRQLLLMLDGIGNPHNLGAIVRTAAFFRVPRIVIWTILSKRAPPMRATAWRKAAWSMSNSSARIISRRRCAACGAVTA